MWILYVAIVLLFLLVFTGAYTFVYACARRKELPWLVEADIKKTSYGKYYKHIMFSHNWLKNHNAQDVFTTSNDGLKLHAYWVPAEKAKGTVLFAHGYRSTYLVDFGLAMEYYHNRGLNLLIPDQRTHGQSEGRFITFGVKESEDMRQWAKYHNAHLCRCPIMLSGMSMGASTMLFLADQDVPDNVKGIIADCGFTSPHAILSVVFRKVTHIPACICLWMTDICARIVAHFGLKEKDTRIVLQNSKLPVLIVHGTKDNFVPCEMSKQAYEKCAEPKKLLLVEGADHGLSFIVDRENYEKAIVAFFDQCGIKI